MTSIIKTPRENVSNKEESVNAYELENPTLPSKHDHEYGHNIRNIQTSALNIISLQEQAKKNGRLTGDEEEQYQENMDSLNEAAQELASLQETSNGFDFEFENREGLSAWFERKKSNPSTSNKKKEEEKKKKEQEAKKKEEERKKAEEKKKQEEKRKEEEKKKEEDKKKKEKEEKEKEENEKENEDDNEGITIELPPEDASVAEAKPVGLAVAGVGGVAASKPIATAVVGPGGLAIARPVGTAIAGVSPDQALVPIYAEGYIAGSKPNRNTTPTKSDATSEYLSRIISKYHQY